LERAAPARGNWVTGITILFPDVFGFKARSAQEQITRADEQTQQAHYDETIQQVTGQMRAARDQLKGAELVAQQTPSELQAARQTETQSRARYQSGLATVVEVAEAENLLAQAETDDAVARLNVWRGLFGVAYAQGDLQNFLQALRGASTGGH
jgi:outer membrane protein TolC